MSKLHEYREKLKEKQLTHEEYHKLMEVFFDFAIIMEEKHPECLKDVEMELHEILFGPHFTRDIAEYKVGEMENQDGSRGQHWTFEQTTELAEDRGVIFDRYNAADFYYMMNMWWSDHFKSTNGNIDLIFEQVMEKLDDKDGIDGFAWWYMQMKAEHKK